MAIIEVHHTQLIMLILPLYLTFYFSHNLIKVSLYFSWYPTMRHHKDIVTLFSSDDQSFSYSKLLGWDLCLNQQYHVKKSNQIKIKSLLLSHHHSTWALVSEILESVLQTVQKQFTYRHTYRLIQMTMCKIHIHILSTRSVLLDILTVINIHYSSYVHILHYVHVFTHNNRRRCNILYISYAMSWMCFRTTRFLYLCRVCVQSSWTVLKLMCSALCPCSPVWTVLKLMCSALCPCSPVWTVLKLMCSAVCPCSPVWTVLKLMCSAWHTVKWECAVGCIISDCSLAW